MGLGLRFDGGGDRNVDDVRRDSSATFCSSTYRSQLFRSFSGMGEGVYFMINDMGYY